MSKNWIVPDTVKLGILIGLVGAIATGYASFATSRVQQNSNSESINIISSRE